MASKPQQPKAPFRCNLCDRGVRELFAYLAPSGVRRTACRECIRTSPFVVKPL